MSYFRQVVLAVALTTLFLLSRRTRAQAERPVDVAPPALDADDPRMPPSGREFDAGSGEATSPKPYAEEEPYADAEVLSDAGTGGRDDATVAVAPLEPARETPIREVPAPSLPFSDKVLEVDVRAQQGPRDALVRSSEAVTVVKLATAKRRAADLGDVLSRTAGVMLLRSGGLGSYGRFSLNGLYDDQIRFFLDGVPLELSGYTQGVANIPLNLIDRVVVYRGVLPVRLGSDALGGAVNLLTSDRYESGATGSYQHSSFGTHRATSGATYRHEATGVVVRASGYFDIARNNYPVDVEVSDARGKLSPAAITRFHDRYRAYGGSVEAGVLDRSWAKVLLARGFFGRYSADLQSNRVMTVPYGDVVYGEQNYGASLRYENTFSHRLKVHGIANLSHRRIDFRDDSDWVYNWYGERVRMRGVPGEIEAKATDQSTWDQTAFGRVFVEYPLTHAHVLRASTTPTFTKRTGDERIQADPNARDPLTAKRNLFTLISGLEYEASGISASREDSAIAAHDFRLQNTVFGKSYMYLADSEDPLPGGAFIERDTHRHHFGVGDALRYTLTSYLQAKASYELTARLPRPDEVFGNGVLILSNLGLQPETSHNVNLGPHLELRKTPIGDVVTDINFFVRESKNLIILLGTERYLTYQNVLQARSVGVEGMFEWTSPGRYVGTTGGFTWVDQRNSANGGTFADTKGDRIPSRPWLTSFWTAQLHFEKLLLPRDALEPYYYGRYVHNFYRGWESQGSTASKAIVPTQVTHALGLSYLLNVKAGRIAATTEMQNIGNAKVYDLYGLQRPGRAYFLKLTGEI